MDEVAIQIRELKKTFNEGKDFVLNGIDLDIPKGKITMIIGFSGTGKSVLMKHILGLMIPTSGDILVLGNSYSEMSLIEKQLFRKEMGVVFQHSALFDDMTALENAVFPMKEHRRNISIREMRKFAHKKLEMAGLESKHFNKYPSELSGGMQKRVALARAIALNPQVLFYDEPTTGLDPILTEMVDNLIKTTHERREGTTSVIISHDLHAAFRLGDFVIMLHEGKVLMQGVPEEFFDTDHKLVRKFVLKGVHRR